MVFQTPWGGAAFLNHECINIRTISSDGANEDYTDLESFDYLFQFRNVKAGDTFSADRGLNCQVSTDNGSSFIGTASAYSYAYDGRLFGGGVSGGSSGATAMDLRGSFCDLDDTAKTSNIDIWVCNATNASLETRVYGFGWYGDSDVIQFMGCRLNGEDNDAVRFICTTGQWVSGKIYQYKIHYPTVSN